MHRRIAAGHLGARAGALGEVVFILINSRRLPVAGSQKESLLATGSPFSMHHGAFARLRPFLKRLELGGVRGVS